jgi:hypothetical protein
LFLLEGCAKGGSKSVNLLVGGCFTSLICNNMLCTQTPGVVMALFDFGPKDVVFTKPNELVNHLKLLFVHGHNDGTTISRMMIDGGTTVNLMLYYLYQKLSKQDSELIRTDMCNTSSTPRPTILTPSSSQGSYIVLKDQHKPFVRTLSSLMRIRGNIPVGHTH